MSTELIEIQAGDGLSVSGRSRLQMPRDVRTPVSSVSYELQFGLVTQEIWVKMNLEPVRYPSFNYSFDPSFVRIRLEMPVRLLKDKDWRDTLQLMIDPGPNPALGQSVIQPVPRFPEGVKILEANPEEIEIVVNRNEEFSP